jgi:5'-3' exonuclease
MYKSIALVDLSCLFKRTFEANPNQGATNTFDALVRIAERVEHTILCLDTPPYKRKEVYPEYKAGREEPTTTERYQKRELYQRLEERGFQMARLQGQEADDVIATLARIYGESCPDVWLVGADKDLAQCVTDNVRILCPPHGDRAEEFRGPKEVKAKYEVWPAQIPLWLALVGDKSDNIPGVKGIGQVKAAGLIGEYKTLTGIAENLGNIGGRMGKDLAEGWEQLVLSLSLTTLDAKLPLDAEALLVKKEPKVTETMAPQVELEFDGFMGNATPMPEPEPAKPEPRVGKDPRADEFLRQEAAARAQAEQSRNADRVAAEQHEREQKREEEWRNQRRVEQQAAAAPKVTEAEFDPIGKSPGASGPLPPKPAIVVALPGLAKASLKGLALLRAPFEKHQISKLPKGTKDQNNCQPSEKRSCAVCGGWHHPKIIHLDYVGHAALTDRLLEADPAWSWEPMGLAPNGLPLFDNSGGLWIRLTVCGVTRLGYGHAASKSGGDPGSREKEIIGDALRNAAMRFGAALELWHKGDDLHDADWDATAAWRDALGGA